MAQSQNTIREILIGNAVATETTLPTFLASASAGELAVIAADGGSPASGKDFYIVLKTGIEASPIIKSDIIKPSQVPTVKVRQKNHVVESLRSISVDDITVPATAGQKAEYIVDIRLYNHGSLSVENFKIFHGHHILTQTSGPLTASNVVDALITNLNRNFSKEPGATATTNPLFTFEKGSTAQTITVTTQPTANATATVTVNGIAIPVAILDADTEAQTATKIAAAIDARPEFAASAAGAVVTVTSQPAGGGVVVSYSPGTTGTAVTIGGAAAASALVITAKPQVLDLGKDEARPLQFDVTVKVNTASGVVGSAQTTVVVAGNPGTGTGRQVALMEYSYRGERGDSLRKLAFPYNWSLSTKSLANPSGRYNLIELFHVVNGDGLNALIMPKEVTIAIEEASGNAVADALKADIDAFL